MGSPYPQTAMRAAGGEDPSRLTEERGSVEPVERLRRGHEIDRERREAGMDSAGATEYSIRS